MPSISLSNLLPQVITSWQVLVITLVFILYVSLVSYVARSYHRPRMSKTKPKKVKPAPPPQEAEKTEATNDEELT